MKYLVTLSSLAFLGLSSAACGDDTGTKGGSCKTSDMCWTVSNPADYNVESECDVTGGVWAQAACNAASYDRKCTQPTEVTVNGATKTVTYVYYFAAANTTMCDGTEEQL